METYEKLGRIKISFTRETSPRVKIFYPRVTESLPAVVSKLNDSCRHLYYKVMMLYIVLSWCYIGQCLFNSLINWCHVTYTLLWTINLFTQQASSSLGASSPLDLSTSGDKYLFSLITTSLFFYMKGSLFETLHQLSGILNAIYYDNDWKLW